MLNLKSIKPVLSLAVLAAALAPSAAFASTVHITPALNAFFGKDKMVHFNLRNQTGVSIELRAGEQTMTVESGKTVTFKLATGTRVITTTKTDQHAAGSVLCEVTSALDDATVIVN